MIKEIEGGVGLAIQIGPDKFLHYLVDDITITNSKMQTQEIWRKVGWWPMRFVFKCKLCEKTLPANNQTMVRIKLYSGTKVQQRCVCKDCLNLLNKTETENIQKEKGVLK
jgi:hypothetical protein